MWFVNKIGEAANEVGKAANAVGNEMGKAANAVGHEFEKAGNAVGNEAKKAAGAAGKEILKSKIIPKEIGKDLIKGCGSVALTESKLREYKDEFITQIDAWARYDFYCFAKNQQGTGHNEPKQGDKLNPPNGWKNSTYLDEEQAVEFVRHLLDKWKARNRCIIKKHDYVLYYIDLNQFGRCLEGALADNKYTERFLIRNYPMNNDWYNIFQVAQFDEDACRECFADLCDGNGRLYYSALENNIIKPLAASIVSAGKKLVG